MDASTEKILKIFSDDIRKIFYKKDNLIISKNEYSVNLYVVKFIYHYFTKLMKVPSENVYKFFVSEFNLENLLQSRMSDDSHNCVEFVKNCLISSKNEKLIIQFVPFFNLNPAGNINPIILTVFNPKVIVHKSFKNYLNKLLTLIFDNNVKVFYKYMQIEYNKGNFYSTVEYLSQKIFKQIIIGKNVKSFEEVNFTSFILDYIMNLSNVVDMGSMFDGSFDILKANVEDAVEHIAGNSYFLGLGYNAVGFIEKLKKRKIKEGMTKEHFYQMFSEVYLDELLSRTEGIVVESFSTRDPFYYVDGEVQKMSKSVQMITDKIRIFYIKPSWFVLDTILNQTAKTFSELLTPSNKIVWSGKEEIKKVIFKFNKPSKRGLELKRMRNKIESRFQSIEKLLEFMKLFDSVKGYADQYTRLGAVIYSYLSENAMALETLYQRYLEMEPSYLELEEQEELTKTIRLYYHQRESYVFEEEKYIDIVKQINKDCGITIGKIKSIINREMKNLFILQMVFDDNKPYLIFMYNIKPAFLRIIKDYNNLDSEESRVFYQILEKISFRWHEFEERSEKYFHVLGFRSLEDFKEMLDTFFVTYQFRKADKEFRNRRIKFSSGLVGMIQRMVYRVKNGKKAKLYFDVEKMISEEHMYVRREISKLK